MCFRVNVADLQWRSNVLAISNNWHSLSVVTCNMHIYMMQLSIFSLFHQNNVQFSKEVSKIPSMGPLLLANSMTMLPPVTP